MREGTWTIQQLDTLRKMVADKQNKFTAKQIGDRIGKARSAVIGKCRRLGLQLPNQHSATGSSKLAPADTMRNIKPPRRKGSFVFPSLPKKDNERNTPRGRLSINFDHEQSGSKPGKIPAELIEVKNPIRFDRRRANQCGYIVGEPRDLMCCGAATSNRYYCDAHHGVTYTGRHHA